MRPLFLSAAWFNWLVALALVFGADRVFALLGVYPLPTEQLFVHFFSAVVFCFGIGYYWIARDFAGNQQILKLGALAKLILVLVGTADWLVGIVSWQILILLVFDLVYSILFFLAYLRFRPVVILQ